MSRALDKQEGGSHYKEMVIQPVEYTFHNNLNFLQGNVVKYITRYKSKNGRQDLEKAIHYIELLIELEYGEEDNGEEYVEIRKVNRGAPNPRR